MTEQEALVFLNITDPNDAGEAFEDLLFEAKQFFVSKPVLRSTYQAKLAKLLNLTKAAQVLNVDLPIAPVGVFSEFQAQNNFLDAFTAFQQVRSESNKLILSAGSTQELEALVYHLLDQFAEYAALWPDMEQVTKTVILSVEPDPMELLAAIRQANSHGIVSFEQLAKDLTLTDSILAVESKRLYILNQKEAEWKKC